MMELSRAQAVRFILSAQGLIGARRYSGKEGALAYVRRAGCIQYDPIDICGRNAELTLFSRVGGFRKSMLQSLLYRDRALVDYVDKELAIFPAEDWPCFSAYRAQSRAHGEEFEGLAPLLEQAVGYISRHGPVSADTLPIPGRIVWHSTIHWSGNWHGDSPAARSALEQLYTDGTLVIHHKEGARKFYDLASRHLPEALLTAADPHPSREDHIAWRVLRRIGAVGLLWNRRSDAFLGIPMTTQQRDQAFARLAGEGRIAAVMVEGVRSPLYLRREDEPLLRSVLSCEADARPRCEFLAPLDPMLWDRRLIETLFGFHYSWEIYTPAEKRRYGYYVLPVLWGERLVGRVEPVRDGNALTVRGLWLEEDVRPNGRLRAAVLAAARRFARFNGCETVYFPEEAWYTQKD